MSSPLLFPRNIYNHSDHTPTLDIGANPSAEEQEEAMEEGATAVIDIVDSFQLQFLGDEASGTRAFSTKKDFMGQFKGEQGILATWYIRQITRKAADRPNLGYLKKVQEAMKASGAGEDKIKEFQKKVQAYFTSKIAPNFKDFDFYSGSSMDPDGMYVSTPLLLFR